MEDETIEKDYLMDVARKEDVFREIKPSSSPSFYQNQLNTKNVD